MTIETELKDKNGNSVLVGDVFEFNTFDSEENTSWTFRYYAKDLNEFVYLGGGIDFGSSIGAIYDLKEVKELIECEDPVSRGVDLVGISKSRELRKNNKNKP